MKNFFKSNDSKNGISLEIVDECVKFSLWKKSSSHDIDLDFATTSELVKFLNDITKNDSESDQITENNRRWEKHIIQTLERKSPEEDENKEDN